jgi:DNA-directed RNA polymerase specialized sigma24 family protein
MDSGSVTHWIERVKEGSESVAEQQLWDRYFSRLAALARKQLDDLPPTDRDDEETALSALNSFFLRARRGDFSRLRDRTDLWQLLARITVRKAIDRRREVQAQKRGRWHARGHSKCETILKNVSANELSPDMLAAINEECQRLLSALKPDLQTVARMKLDGYTNREIAGALGRVERTIERKLNLIRHAWLKEVDGA